MKSFKNYIMIFALSLTFLLLFTSCGDKTSSILEIDGNYTQVYRTEADAEKAPIQMNKGESHVLSVGDDAQITGKALEILPVPFVVKDNGVSGHKRDYTMDLGIIPFHTTLKLEITIGGEDTFVGKRMYGESDAEKYYLVVEVITDGSAPSDSSSTDDTTTSVPQTTSQPSDTTTSSSNDTSSTTTSEPSTSTATSNDIIPNGVVYFGDDRVRFNTYSSEVDAQQAAATSRNSTLLTYMVKDGLYVEAEPDPGTARIRVQVCMVDQEGVSSGGVRLNQDSNWAGVLDLTAYAGHQVTLMLHAGNNSGMSNGYSYVSVFIPEF